MASANGHKTVVEYLLSLGASPNEIESDQWSPLMFAAYQGYTEVALALFTAGANPLLKNNNHLTAHELAINRGNYDTAGIIGEETLRYAISLGSVDDVLRCVRLGVNPNLQNSVGWTALMVTSSNQAVEATRELINLGADVNLEEQDGWTPLMFTAHNGNVEVAELLIQAGADRSHETKNHDNPLQHAVARNQQRLVEYLRKDSTLGQSTMSSIPSEYQVDPTLQPVDSAPIEPADSSIIGKTLKKKKFFGLF